MRQILRYGIVGLASNGLLYLFYLALTARGMGPKTAISLLYTVGTLQAFYFNRAWTFGHKGVVPNAFVKYILCYALGYLFNWIVLYTLVDRAGWPHRPVQAVQVLITAILLFILQKVWVFPQEPSRNDVPPRRTS